MCNVYSTPVCIRYLVFLSEPAVFVLPFDLWDAILRIRSCMCEYRSGERRHGGRACEQEGEQEATYIHAHWNTTGVFIWNSGQE